MSVATLAQAFLAQPQAASVVLDSRGSVVGVLVLVEMLKYSSGIAPKLVFNSVWNDSEEESWAESPPSVGAAGMNLYDNVSK